MSDKEVKIKKYINIINSLTDKLISILDFILKTNKKPEEISGESDAPETKNIITEEQPQTLLASEPIKKGLWVIGILVTVFIIWGCVMKIDSAAIATGTIVVDTNKKTIQHLEGGIIEEILVADGQSVKAGQSLIRLDTTSAKANVDILMKQMFTLQTTKQRLEFERDMDINNSKNEKLEKKIIKIVNKTETSPKTKIKQNTKPKPIQYKITKQKKYINITAQKGNTIYRFARRYKVRPSQIIKENNLQKPYLLEIGQKLKIPQIIEIKEPIKIKTEGSIKIEDVNKIEADKKLDSDTKITIESNKLDNESNISVKIFSFDKEKFNTKGDLELKKILDGEIKLFNTRKKSIKGQINLLSQKKGQFRKQIEGLKAQEKATNERIAYIKDELKSTEILYKKGIVSKIRYLDLKKQLSELKGDKGEYISSIAQAKQSIGETDMEIINTKTQWLNEIIKELQQVQSEIVNLQERIVAADDILRRTIITAPQDGIITDLKFHTKGGVIAPNVPIMDIVPQNDELVVEARVNPQDIDVVHPGLKSKVMLSAYKQKKVPLLHGELIYVSADSFLDQMTGMSYYKARVRIDIKELKALENVKLYPGMPAETYIVTGSRTFFQYLISPVTDSMRRAFRED